MRLEKLKFERIRSLRIDNDHSQEEIANYLHVKQNTYSQYEIGLRDYPIDLIMRLALFYNTSTDYLLGMTDNPDPYERPKKDPFKID